MNGDVTGYGVVNSGGGGVATGTVLAATHCNDIVGVVKKRHAIHLGAFGNKVSNYCKIDTLVVEKVTGSGFGNSLGHMDTKSFSLKLVVAKVVPDRS